MQQEAFDELKSVNTTAPRVAYSDKSKEKFSIMIPIALTLLKISQGVEPSVGFLDNIIAVNNPW